MKFDSELTAHERNEEVRTLANHQRRPTALTHGHCLAEVLGDRPAKLRGQQP